MCSLSAESDVVQRLRFLALTQAVRVRLPASECSFVARFTGVKNSELAFYADSQRGIQFVRLSPIAQGYLSLESLLIITRGN